MITPNSLASTALPIPVPDSLPPMEADAALDASAMALQMRRRAALLDGQKRKQETEEEANRRAALAYMLRACADELEQQCDEQLQEAAKHAREEKAEQAHEVGSITPGEWTTGDGWIDLKHHEVVYVSAQSEIVAQCWLTGTDRSLKHDEQRRETAANAGYIGAIPELREVAFTAAMLNSEAFLKSVAPDAAPVLKALASDARTAIAKANRSAEIVYRARPKAIAEESASARGNFRRQSR